MTEMSHKLTLLERKKLTVTGVTEVISFDENEALLRTPLGALVVQGEQLQLKNLSPEEGQVGVEGQITALLYEEPRTGGGFLRRLFK